MAIPPSADSHAGGGADEENQDNSGEIRGLICSDFTFCHIGNWKNCVAKKGEMWFNCGWGFHTRNSRKPSFPKESA